MRRLFRRGPAGKNPTKGTTAPDLPSDKYPTLPPADLVEEPSLNSKPSPMRAQPPPIPDSRERTIKLLLHDVEIVPDVLQKAAVTTPADASLIGQVLSGHRDEKGRIVFYKTLSLLGKGGMGAVYLGVKCDHLGNELAPEEGEVNRKVAVKFLLTETDSRDDPRARIVREAESVMNLDHPNIVKALGFGLHENDPYIIFEFLDGFSLSKIELPVIWRFLKPVALSICDGLAAAHAKNMIHRDLKPGNIFITNNGEVKLLDFGCVKVLGDNRFPTAHGLVLGSPNYLSPEQLRGQKCDPRTDLFSLGVMLYKMLTNKFPHTGDKDHEIIHAKIHGYPIPISTNCLSRAPAPAVEKLIMKLLEPEPGDRYQSAEEVRNDILRSDESVRAATSDLTGPEAPAHADYEVLPVPQPVLLDKIKSTPASTEANPAKEAGPAAVPKPKRRIVLPAAIAVAALATAAVLTRRSWYPLAESYLRSDSGRKQAETNKEAIPARETPAGDNPVPASKRTKAPAKKRHKKPVATAVAPPGVAQDLGVPPDLNSDAKEPHDPGVPNSGKD